jgi:hypothetical protein
MSEAIRKYMPAVTASAMLCLLLYLLFPYYSGCLDADSIAYLTIAKRYAAGDYFTAINGYWNPFSCWLAAILIKAGAEPIAGAIAINGLAGMGYIFISQSFFLRFGLMRSLQWLLSISITFFLCYAVYLQWFADLWMCFFLLCCLRLLVSERFAERRWFWVLCGICGGLAYLSKAYALPFFILQTGVFVLISVKNKEGKKRIAGLLASLAIAGVLSFSWVWHLHAKYHVWTIGTAGSMNVSWALNGKQYWKDEYKFLVPPAHASSPYLWEDPYLVGKVMPYQGSNMSFIKSQAVRMVYNLSKMGTDLGAISCFMALAVVFALALLFSKRVRSYFPERLNLVAASMVLLPPGYMIVVSEERYLWYLLPLSMLLLALVIQKALPLVNMKGFRIATLGIFAISYVCNPVMKLKEMFKDGIEDREIARAMQAAGIRGTFTANPRPGPEKQRVIRISYYMDDFHYYHPINRFRVANLPSFEELKGEMKRQGVKYYMHFAREADGAGYQLPAPELKLGVQTNFRLFYDLD